MCMQIKGSSHLKKYISKLNQNTKVLLNLYQQYKISMVYKIRY
jgi:hypothetical protein